MVATYPGSSEVDAVELVPVPPTGANDNPSAPLAVFQLVQPINQWQRVANALDEARNLSQGVDSILMGSFKYWGNWFEKSIPGINAWTLKHFGQEGQDDVKDGEQVVEDTHSPAQGLGTVLTDVIKKNGFYSWFAQKEYAIGLTPASTVFGGLNTAISTNSAINTMADPNSTTFSKIAHWVHVGTSAIGMWPMQVTLGIAIAGDLGMMGLQGLGYLNDKPVPQYELLKLGGKVALVGVPRSSIEKLAKEKPGVVLIPPQK